MDWLIEPFTFSFIWYAILSSSLVGISCGVLGVYVVQRRMAFIGEALSHTTLPGLVIAHLYGWSLTFGGMIAALLTALLIGFVSRKQKIKEDTAIGVIFTGMFALGIILMSRTKSYRDLTHILFGNVLGVSENDIYLIILVTFIVLSALFLFHKELELASFDPTHGEVIGIKSDNLRFLLLGLLALAVVTGIQAVGVILTNALLITPAATACLLTDSLIKRMFFSSIIAISASISGIMLSYFFHVSSGAAIVLSCTFLFGLIHLSKSYFNKDY